MSKWKLLVALLVLPFNALAQQTPERDQFTATALQIANKAFTARHNESSMGVSLTHAFEFKFDTAPTYTYTITPCMRGGTCGTATTASVSANATVTVAGTLADYYTVSVTWAGGTVTTLAVNITAVPQSAKTGGACGANNIPCTNTANTFSSGAQTFAAPILASSGSPSAPGYGFSSDTNMGFFDAGGNLGMALGGSTGIFWNGNQQAMINTMCPGWSTNPTGAAMRTRICEASPGGLSGTYVSFDTSTPNNGLGGIVVTNLVGQPTTAPTGTCPTAGVWQLSKDGHLTFCPSAGGTWTTKI